MLFALSLFFFWWNIRFHDHDNHTKQNKIVTLNSMMTTMMHNKKIVIKNKQKMTKMKNGKPKQCAEKKWN